MYVLHYRWTRSFRQATFVQLTQTQREQLTSFRNKATGWFTVAAAALLAGRRGDLADRRAPPLAGHYLFLSSRSSNPIPEAEPTPAGSTGQAKVPTLAFIRPPHRRLCGPSGHLHSIMIQPPLSRPVTGRAFRWDRITEAVGSARRALGSDGQIPALGFVLSRRSSRGGVKVGSLPSRR